MLNCKAILGRLIHGSGEQHPIKFVRVNFVFKHEKFVFGRYGECVIDPNKSGVDYPVITDVLTWRFWVLVPPPAIIVPAVGSPLLAVTYFLNMTNIITSSVGGDLTYKVVEFGREGCRLESSHRRPT